jgi:hypothetical protein
MFAELEENEAGATKIRQWLRRVSGRPDQGREDPLPGGP